MNLLRYLSRPERASSPAEVLKRIDDDVRTMITRNRFMGEELTMGPNFVHVAVFRGDSGEAGPAGEVLDLGWFHNLKTNTGMDWLHTTMGGGTAIQGSPATATSATSFTATGTPWSSNALTGWRVVFPVTGLTTAPVYGNILSNTTSVAQVDQWYTAADAQGGTPASTNAFIILPGQGPARFIGLTNDATAAGTADSSLTSEITANGLNRALATFAHSALATTYTLTKTWTATGAQSAQKAGNFTGGYGASGGGIMVAETAFTAATLATNDSLQLTWTWTLPAAG